MKKILRSALLLIFALITTNYIWHNLFFEQEVITLIKVAFILAIFEIFLRPILNILLLPITIITLGAIRIIIGTLGLFLATYFISDFTINTIDTPSSQLLGFTIPNLHYEGLIAYIVTSITISICYNLFSLIIKRKAVK